MITRIAVIGDVHGHDAQLNVALQSISQTTVDVVACTGDVADGRGCVATCCRLLRDYDVACVRGNHDRWLFSGLLRDAPHATELDSLTEEDRTYLQGLPPTLTYRLHGGGSLLLCHGVGTSDLEKFTELHTDYSIRQNRPLQAVLAAGHRVMVNGHTHERCVMRVGPLTIINAGTLKHPEDPGFVLLDFAANRLEWHSIVGTKTRLAEERCIF
jgi:predicted phosphodiesterase